MLDRWIEELQTDESDVFRGNGKLTADRRSRGACEWRIGV